MGDDLPPARCDYVFQMSRRVGTKTEYLYVDAEPANFSNWTRYVNGAKTKEQRKKVNMEVYQYGQKLYYRSSEDIDTDEELLIDYGSDYWTDSESSSSDDESDEEGGTTEMEDEETSEEDSTD